MYTKCILYTVWVGGGSSGKVQAVGSLPFKKMAFGRDAERLTVTMFHLFLS